MQSHERSVSFCLKYFQILFFGNATKDSAINKAAPARICSGYPTTFSAGINIGRIHSAPAGGTYAFSFVRIKIINTAATTAANVKDKSKDM